MPALNLDDEGYVYFATFDHKTVKVGFAKEVRTRMLQIQVSSPTDIHLLAAYPGTPAEERRVHALLKKCHAKREWFYNTNLVDDLLYDIGDAEMLLRMEHGEDYEPTLKECLDYKDAGKKMDDFIACFSKGMRMIRDATP